MKIVFIGEAPDAREAAYTAVRTVIKPKDDAIIEKGAHGKPFFANSNGLFFNISHSFSLYAAAVCDAEVGVDIEKIRLFPEKVIKRVFTEAEREYAAGDARRFFEMWTKKEAYFKFTGEGISGGFLSFDTISDQLAQNFFTQYIPELEAVFTLYSETSEKPEILINI